VAMLRWEPFHEIENVLRRFSPLYMPDNGASRNESTARSWIPLANISETENEYLIKLELPDVKKGRREDCGGGRRYHDQRRA
jgi:HSP20 family protein